MAAPNPSTSDTPSVERLLGKELSDIKIPPRPAVLSHIEKEMHSRSPNLASLGEIISVDVGVSASLLKIANSAYFGHCGTVRSIKEALQILGLNTVANAIAALSLRKAFAHVPNLERFWDSSARIAQLSGWIVGQLRETPFMVRPEEAFTFGLFRDCGMPAILSMFDDYFDILRVANNESERPFTAVEDAAMELNHAVVGGLLAQEWKLPIEFRNAIELHHDVNAIRGGATQNIPDAARQFMAVSQLAEYLFQSVSGMSKSCEWSKLGEACLEVLRLQEEAIPALLEAARAEGVHTQPVI